MEEQRILVTGADGMLGTYIHYGERTDKGILDVTSLSSVREVCARYAPSVILHLAAATDLDHAEREPSYAYGINTTGTYYVARVAEELHAKMVYISTAAIFEGAEERAYAENDIPSPRNMYGHSKFLGECAVRGVLSDFLIIRTCWLMGGGRMRDHKFVGKIVNLLENPETKELRAVSDQYGSPTYAKDLAAEILSLIQGGVCGIRHVVNSGKASRFDMAQNIAHSIRPDVPVVRVPAASFSLDARRTNEVLSSQYGYMRPWQDALQEYIQKEWSGSPSL